MPFVITAVCVVLFITMLYQTGALATLMKGSWTDARAELIDNGPRVLTDYYERAVHGTFWFCTSIVHALIAAYRQISLSIDFVSRGFSQSLWTARQDARAFLEGPKVQEAVASTKVAMKSVVESVTTHPIVAGVVTPIHSTVEGVSATVSSAIGMVTEHPLIVNTHHAITQGADTAAEGLSAAHDVLNDIASNPELNSAIASSIKGVHSAASAVASAAAAGYGVANDLIHIRDIQRVVYDSKDAVASVLHAGVGIVASVQQQHTVDGIAILHGDEQ